MVQQKSRTQGLNGLVALAYLGVQPSTPSNFIVKQGAPTPNDYRNVYVGDWWLDNSSMYLSPSVAPTTANLWILVSVVGHVATWIDFGGAAGLVTLTGNSGGAVSPLGNNINILGDTTTINIVGNPGTHTLTVSTSGSVATQYITDFGTAVPLAGVLYIDAGTALVNSGSSVIFTGAANVVLLNVTDINFNTMIGKNAGNITTMTGIDNTCVGYNCGKSMTSSSYTCGFGFRTLENITNGIENCAFGYESLVSLVSGELNIAIGGTSGSAYSGAESSNILINSFGVLGESNVIRIGRQGTGPGLQNTAFMAGIVGVTVANQEFVTINSATGQLGVSAGSGGTGVNLSMIGTGGSPFNQITTSSITTWIAPFSTQNDVIQGRTQFIVPIAGTISNLYVNSTVNGSTTNCTFTLNVNSANTPLVATVTALTTGEFSDLIHSVAVNAGDVIQFECQASTTGVINGEISAAFGTPNGSFTNSFITSPATGTATPVAGILTFAGAGGATVSAAGSTITITNSGGIVHSILSGEESTDLGGLTWGAPGSQPANTQALAQMVMPTAGTISDMYVYVATNADTANYTVTLNKNSVNTTLVVTVTALTTGVFSDLVHSVAYAAGDLLQWESSQATTSDSGGVVSMQFVG